MKLFSSYKRAKNLRNFNIRTDKLSRQPWFQGILLVACVILAMIMANVPGLKELYRSFLGTELTIHLMSPNRMLDIFFPRDMTMEKFINDVLMVLFFFTVGLEIKREVISGELSSFKKAILPVIAAFGGVITPALIFFAVNHGTFAQSGWGIPTATDIAFAICILSVLGDKVPLSLKVFLTALAVADDLIAILVVALFYGGRINLLLLLIALVVIGLTFLMRRRNVQSMGPYVVATIIVWILFYYSGIHATMSGVVMSFIIPVQPRFSRSYVAHKLPMFCKRLLNYDNSVEPFPSDSQKHALFKIKDTAVNAINMSSRIEHHLSPWVNFLILPLFALANSGVEIPDLSYLNVFAFDKVLGGAGLGVFLGLVVGKPVGITLFSYAAIKSKVADMPSSSTWPLFFAVACLGGIGFTMSLFVDTLSFGGLEPEITTHLKNAGKIAVLLGSLCSAILGTVLINLVHKIQDKNAVA